MKHLPPSVRNNFESNRGETLFRQFSTFYIFYTFDYPLPSTIELAIKFKNNLLTELWENIYYKYCFGLPQKVICNISALS